MSLAMWLALGSDTSLIVGVLTVRVVTILKMLKDIRTSAFQWRPLLAHLASNWSKWQRNDSFSMSTYFR